MKNLKHLLIIKKAKIIQAKHSKRYGLQLTLYYNYLEKDLYFFETFWFGNYLDFFENHINKSTFIWHSLLEKFQQMGFLPGIYEEPEKLIGLSFYGILATNLNGIYLDKIATEN